MWKDNDIKILKQFFLKKIICLVNVEISLKLY